MPIRALHLSTTDTKGGAARAAHHLHRSLVQSGHDSTMLVPYKDTEDPLVEQARRPTSLLPRARRVGNPVKGLRLLPAAAESLAPRHAFALVNIGERTDKETSAVERKQENLYSAIDLFVHPSTWETFGLVVAEAMACSTPVVAFDIGAMRELVFPSVNGWLTHAGDAQDLERAIESAIGVGEDTRKPMGEKGREHIAQNSSFPSVARRHAALYETLIEEANSAR